MSRVYPVYGNRIYAEALFSCACAFFDDYVLPECDLELAFPFGIEVEQRLRRRSRRDAARPRDVFALEPPHQILDVRVGVARQVSEGALAVTRPSLNEVRPDHEGVSRLRREWHLHRGAAALAPLQARFLPTPVESTARCHHSPPPRLLLFVIPDALSRSVSVQFLSVIVILRTVLLDRTVVLRRLLLTLGEVNVVHERPPEPPTNIHILTHRRHFHPRFRLVHEFDLFTTGLAPNRESSVLLWLENPMLNGMGHIELDLSRSTVVRHVGPVDDYVIQVDPGAIVPQWQNLFRGKNCFGGTTRVVPFFAADAYDESCFPDEDEACGGLLVHLELELQLLRR